jgi:hypothetical protein
MALAYGARPALAIATPFVMLRLVTDPDAWGFNYPILLIEHGHTYGTAGLAWLVLVGGLLGAGCTRTGAFLLGLAPAVHASLGAIFGLLTGVCALLGPRALRRPRVVAAGAAGLALSLVSLAAQRYLSPAAPNADPAIAARYLGAFVRLWDWHRQPADLAAWNAMMVWCALLFSIVLLRWVRARLPADNQFATRIFLACGLLGLAVDIGLRSKLIEAASPAMAMAMPTRFLNFPALAFLPLLIGFSDRWREQPAARLLLFSIAVIAVLGPHFPWLQQNGYWVFCLLPLVLALQVAPRRAALRFVAIGLLFYAALRAMWSGTAFLGFAGTASLAAIVIVTAAAMLAWIGVEAHLELAFGRIRSVVATHIQRVPAARMAALHTRVDVAIALAFSVAVIAVIAPAVANAPARFALLHDRSNDAALAAASQTDGVLLIGPGLDRIQLRTRRPVLLDPEALDMLPYAADGGGRDRAHPRRGVRHRLLPSAA